MKTPKILILSLLCSLLFTIPILCLAADPVGNRPERVEWFRDLGFGLFIHWSPDSQLGSVIAHSLVGASPDYAKRYFDLIPKSFNPKKFNAEDWAVLSKLAGLKYVVFTAKHHAGFCMYDSKETDFSIMNTPYGRDLTRELVDAFRKQGIAIGFYFSPDDFHFLYRQGRQISRRRPGAIPQENPPLMKFARKQIRELLTRYGKIDVMFIDGRADGLRELCWELQPDIVVTRGAMETPEQTIPGVPLEGAWEANLTMGTAWQYKPTHETYKSGTDLIQRLIETRAKGGNQLLNVGPKPDGELPIEQEALLREFALWNFANGESIYGVRPWVLTNEGDIWFTKKKDEDTVYAFVTRTPWGYGERKIFTLKSVKATEQTKVQVLGHGGEVLEYSPDVDPKPTWRQDAQGLHVNAMRAQRFYNNRRWPNPVVLKITHVRPTFLPPKVEVADAEWNAKSRVATLHGVLKDMGTAGSVEVGFQYRRRKGTLELYEPDEAWKDTPYRTRTAPGNFAAKVTGLKKGGSYEFRAVVKHPVMTFPSVQKIFDTSE